MSKAPLLLILLSLVSFAQTGGESKPSYKTGMHTHMAWPRHLRAAFDAFSEIDFGVTDTNWRYMDLPNLIDDANNRNPSLIAHGGIHWDLNGFSLSCNSRDGAEESGEFARASAPVSFVDCDTVETLEGLDAPIIAQIKFLPNQFEQDLPSPLDGRRNLALLLGKSDGTLETESDIVIPDGPDIYHNGLYRYFQFRPPAFVQVDSDNPPTALQVLSPGANSAHWQMEIDFDLPDPNDPDANTPVQNWVLDQYRQFLTDLESKGDIDYYLLGNEPNGTMHPRLYARLVALLDQLTDKPIILGNLIPSEPLLPVWLEEVRLEFTRIYPNIGSVAPPFQAAAIDYYANPDFSDLPAIQAIDATWKDAIHQIYEMFDEGNTEPTFIVKEAGFGEWGDDLAEINGPANQGELDQDLKQTIRRYITFLHNLGNEEVIWFNQFKVFFEHGTLALIQPDGSVVETKMGAFLRRMNHTSMAAVDPLEVDLPATPKFYQAGDTVPLQVTFKDDLQLGFGSGRYRVYLRNQNGGQPFLVVGPLDVANIPAGGPLGLTRTVSFTAPSPGIYDVEVQFDPDDTGFLTHYSAETTLYVPYLDQLWIEGFSGSTPIYQGQDVTVKWTPLYFPQFAKGTLTATGAHQIYDRAPLDYSPVSFGWDVDVTGNKSLTLTSNDDGRVSVRSGPTYQFLAPHLSVSQPNGQSVPVGTPMDIVWDWQGEAGAVVSLVSISPQGGATDIAQITQVAGANSYVWNQNLSPGSGYRVRFELRGRPHGPTVWDSPFYEIVGSPDLTVENAVVSPAAPVQGPNGSISLEFTVKNLGQAASASTQVTATFSGPLIGDETLSWNVPALAAAGAAGDEQRILYACRACGYEASGTYTLTIHATAVPGETVTANNTEILTIQVAPSSK